MAPPANDNFASATSIATASGTLGGTTFDATKEASESTTIGTNVQSVWYVFTVPTTGWYKFWIPASDMVDHDIRAFDNGTIGINVFPDGALSAMTLTNEIADGFRGSSGSPKDAQVAFFATSSTVLRIRVYSSMDSAAPGGLNTQTMDFTLHWAQLSRPTSDDLANVIDLGSVPVAETGITTFDATMESGEQQALSVTSSYSTTDPAVQSVWYKFTPAVSGKYHFRVENVVNQGNDHQETRLQVSTQSTLAGYTVANELGHLSFGFVAGTANGYFDLVGGTDYYIRAASTYGKKNAGVAYNNNSVMFDLAIRLIDPPANDDFADAIVLSTTLPGSVTNQDTYDATQEATEPDSGFPNNPDDQTIWYSFTPTVSGVYRFTVPRSSLVYTGDNDNPNNGELQWQLAEITDPADFTSGNLIGGFKFSQITDVADEVLQVPLVASTTYYLRFWLDGSPFNNDACQFDLEYDLIPPPDNDNFADRITLTGASGTEDFEVIGSTSEASEPPPFYWWEDSVANIGSIWYEWVAPSSGWFEFEFEPDGSIPNNSYDVAFYTGSSLAGLTAIVKNEAGGTTDNSPTGGKTVIRFLAVSGTSYKIQVALSTFTLGNILSGAGTITWASASAPTGDTTSAAVSSGGVVNNYGNTDDELPPNAVTRLSGHDDWYYTDGAVGRSKWFAFTAGEDGVITVSGEILDGINTQYSEYALLVYKGANFAGLTNATTDDLEDAVMIGFSSDPATTLDGADSMDISYTTGETVWVCLVGLYDKDYNADTVDIGSESCPQTELVLGFAPPVPDPPANDNRSAVRFDNHFWLANSHWDDYTLPNSVWPEALAIDGTTISATAEVGDPTIAGFAPTRNVWYATSWAVPIGTNIKVWVESAVDCVLAIYEINGILAPFGTPTVGSLVDDDDDSGTGDQPEITFAYNNKDYYIIVDSKTEGDFTLKYEVQHTGTPPANDDFADAEVISSIPFSSAGTTVDATAEPGEWDAAELGVGPRDTVWYKYVADHDGQLRVRATVQSNNEDAYVYVDTWHGTTLANLVRNPDPPPQGPGGGLNRGFFNFFDTPAEIDAQAVTLNIVNGETYYIRVQTETGGSEDFTLFLDEEAVYVNIQPGGSDEMHGVLIDSAEVYINIQVSSFENFHQATALDSATVYIDIQVGGNDIKGHEYIDTATVRVSIAIDSHDCQSHFDVNQLTAYAFDRFDFPVLDRFEGTDALDRFEVIAGDGLEEC